MTGVAVALPAVSDSRSRLARGLLVFIWLLPFHILVMALLFGGLGVAGPVVRVFAAWKEALIAVLVAATVLRAVAVTGERSAVQWLDVAVFGLGLVSLLYLLGAAYWFGFDLPIVARLYGFRDAVFFSLLYFVGRATPEVVRDARVLKALFAVGVITSAVAIVERFFVTPQMLVVLGAAEYFQDFLGATLFTADNPYGLPINYWVLIGSRLVQRAGSTYLSSQGFAIPFLLIVPAATIWLVDRNRSAWAKVGYAVLWIGLLLSITRMTIVACLVQAVAIAALRRRWDVITTVGVALAAAFGVALVLLPGFATYVWETLTWQSASSLSHFDDWVEGVGNALRFPFGAGLGVADQTAIRFGLSPLAGDNQYLKYAVETGVLGLGLHLATMTGTMLAGIRSARGGDPMTAEYGVLLAATSLGILFNAMTAVVFNSMMLTYIFFWLAGSLVSARLEEEPR